MNGEQKFWVTLWLGFAVVVATITLIIASYHAGENRLIAAMVKEGYSPIEARCALKDTYGKNPVCVLTATKE